jgi:hypothetical protein
MKYYKIIKNKEFIGVGTTLNLCRFQTKHQIILICDETQVQYIWLDGTFYRADWMWPKNTDSIKYEIADVIRIEKDEYDLLLKAVETNEEIAIEEEPAVETAPVVVENPTIDYVRSSKIAKLKRDCNKAITNGVDIKLSDGETRHFSMSLEDQINLLTMAYLGDESVYSTKDMKMIITEINAFKNSHIAKFKKLKDRVSSLNTIQEVSAVNYHEEV